MPSSVGEPFVRSWHCVPAAFNKRRMLLLSCVRKSQSVGNIAMNIRDIECIGLLGLRVWS
jgi:hypothetical protein